MKTKFRGQIRTAQRGQDAEPSQIGGDDAAATNLVGQLSAPASASTEVGANPNRGLATI
jgi:hypothetical protein